MARKTIKAATKKKASVKTGRTAGRSTSSKSAKEEKIFLDRLAARDDELRWLFMELYDNGDMYGELLEQMKVFYTSRNSSLKKLDLGREADPDWYRRNDLLGMMFYIDNFAGDMNGVRKKLPYLEKVGVNMVHLMPFLDTVEGRSDGGYAVKDFRKVRPDLGTMEDLEKLTAACRKKGISVCMDFVMNHTNEEHEWAQKARTGDLEYMSRYFFFDNEQAVKDYDAIVPMVFPTTAPGNFTWCEAVDQWVMTSFYPYQWDLNYRNPRVFNEMVYNMLYLANQGIDVIRIDAVPYIWKELGTSCRNLPQVHTIVRMMRLISEIVCPGIILLGEVVMEPIKVVPYFGTVEKPECHMLYNVTTMATIWNTVATRDTELLRRQLDTVYHLPKDYVFLNYLRCHDDIGWGLDYDFLKMRGIDEVAHKKYLNDYFQGWAGYSHSRGELYNDDPITKDARFCGTTASICGIETAADHDSLAQGIQEDLMLHAFMLMQSGIPILYSGDEIGQLNDYSYKDDPKKFDDSRYIHRGKMRWDLVDKIKKAGSTEQQIYDGIKALTDLRKSDDIFQAKADCWLIDTNNPSVICIGRYIEGEQVIGIFNFSEHFTDAWPHVEGSYTDMLTGQEMSADTFSLTPYGFYLLKRTF